MNKSTPFYSIVIPLYNKKDEVLRALHSILEQTYKNFEVIIVNDGSTDGSSELARSISDNRFRVIDQINQGQGAARNSGIYNSTGEYIAFLDADDTWEPRHLEVISGLIEVQPDAGAYATAFRYKKFNGVESKKIKFKNISNSPWHGELKGYLLSLVNETSPITTNSICVRRDLFQTVGEFNAQLPLAQDIDLWIRIFLKSKIFYTTEHTTNYHLETGNQVTRQLGKHQKYLKFAENLDKYIIDDTVGENNKSILKKIQNNIVINSLWQAVALGDYDFAINAMRLDFIRQRKTTIALISIIIRIIPARLMRAVHKIKSGLRNKLIFIRYRLLGK